VSVGVGVSVKVGVGVSVKVGEGVLVEVCVGVYVAVGFGVFVEVGSGVYVPVLGGGGPDVRLGGIEVANRKPAAVLKAKGLFVGVRVVVGASVAALVLVISGRENACTVSTIIVFILEMTKSTIPAVGVPMETALLISFMPTTPTPHSKLTPSAAAATIPKSG
jgi:hypothetical protein